VVAAVLNFASKLVYWKVRKGCGRKKPCSEFKVSSWNLPEVLRETTKNSAKMSGLCAEI
jgi:hypothetical protein